MTGLTTKWLQRRAADTVVASADTVGESNSVEIYVRADLIRNSGNRLYARGYDVERHEYPRGHNVAVTLERRAAAGSWVVVARAEGSGVEGVGATTGAHPGDEAFGSCAAARVDAGETVAVCTG